MKLKVHSANPDVDYSSLLEEGDYVPYFYIEHGNRVLDIQVKASRPILLIIVDQQASEEMSRALEEPVPYSRFVITNGPSSLNSDSLFADANVSRLFARKGSPVTVCLCDANLKIRYLRSGASVVDLLGGLEECDVAVSNGSPPPVLMVPDVISDDLARRLIEYLENNKQNAFSNSTDYKSRSHIHPDMALERELDDKLSKSLLPEIEKVFYSDITHRETYKICCYDAEDDGCFGKHRDTIDPHLHRRYALTLVLNDDFEGGGISFPEYSDELVAIPRNWAVVFPGSLYHQVHNIGVGRRYVIISFLFSEAEARLKEDSDRYRFRVRRDLGNLTINKLTPDYLGSDQESR